MIVHLTTHSAYSLQEGLPLPGELVQAAQRVGMTALGLTDHRLLSGSVEFAVACKKEGIQPILGSRSTWRAVRYPYWRPAPRGGPTCAS